MNHPNMYAVGLALCTFTDIASEEMSRDLCNEIEKLVGPSSSYIRKKVGLDLFLPFPWLTIRIRPHCVPCESYGRCQTCRTTL